MAYGGVAECLRRFRASAIFIFLPCGFLSGFFCLCRISKHFHFCTCWFASLSPTWLEAWEEFLVRCQAVQAAVAGIQSAVAETGEQAVSEAASTEGAQTPKTVAAQARRRFVDSFESVDASLVSRQFLESARFSPTKSPCSAQPQPHWQLQH